MSNTMRRVIFFLGFLILCVRTEAQEPLAQRIAFDYSRMYEALNPSVVKIHADVRVS